MIQTFLIRLTAILITALLSSNCAHIHCPPRTLAIVPPESPYLRDKTIMALSSLDSIMRRDMGLPLQWAWAADGWVSLEVSESMPGEEGWPGNITGVATTRYGADGIISCEICLKDEEYHAGTILHELGHCLGWEHDALEWELMWPYCPKEHLMLDRFMSYASVDSLMTCWDIWPEGELEELEDQALSQSLP